MTNDAPLGLEVGATLTTAMISPVAGGLVRTWTETDASCGASMTRPD